MSPYTDISARLGELASQVNDSINQVSTPFPGSGKTVDAANDRRAAITQHLASLADWLQTASSTASAQASYDKGLESAPSPEDIKSLREACHASGNDPEVVQELKDSMSKKEQAQQRHDGETAGTEWGDQPAAPAGCPVPSSNPNNGDYGDGTGDGLGDLGGDRTEDPDVEGAEDTPDTPVTMSTGTEPEAPVTMSTGTGTEPEPVNDNAVSTETSSDTMPPTTGAGTGQLTQPTQPTPGGQPMQGTHGAPPAAFGASGGAQGQLSQPQTPRHGTPQSPEKKRETQDRQDERDAALDAGTGVAGVTAAGVMGAGLTSSPPTNTFGAQGVTPPQGTPPTTNTPPPAGGGVMGGAGGVRPPNGAMGSGENVAHMKRPVILRSEEELDRELDELLGIRVPDDSDKEPTR